MENLLRRPRPLGEPTVRGGTSHYDYALDLHNSWTSRAADILHPAEAPRSSFNPFPTTPSDAALVPVSHSGDRQHSPSLWREVVQRIDALRFVEKPEDRDRATRVILDEGIRKYDSIVDNGEKEVAPKKPPLSTTGCNTEAAPVSELLPSSKWKLDKVKQRLRDVSYESRDVLSRTEVVHLLDDVEQLLLSPATHQGENVLSDALSAADQPCVTSTRDASVQSVPLPDDCARNVGVSVATSSDEMRCRAEEISQTEDDRPPPAAVPHTTAPPPAPPPASLPTVPLPSALQLSAATAQCDAAAGWAQYLWTLYYYYPDQYRQLYEANPSYWGESQEEGVLPASSLADHHRSSAAKAALARAEYAASLQPRPTAATADLVPQTRAPSLRDSHLSAPMNDYPSHGDSSTKHMPGTRLVRSNSPTSSPRRRTEAAANRLQKYHDRRNVTPRTRSGRHDFGLTGAKPQAAWK